MVSVRTTINLTHDQARTADGVPRFDLIKSRHGRKYFAKVVKEEKDHSWREMIVKIVIEVFFFNA